MAAGNHFLYPSGKQRVHYANKRFSELHLNPRSSCNKIGSPCVTFDILALISLVALFMKRSTGRKEFGVMTSSEHKITEFSMVFFCMFNRYMPTFYSRKLHRDLCILLDQEMLKLIFTNTFKTFFPAPLTLTRSVMFKRQLNLLAHQKKAVYRDQEKADKRVTTSS